MTDWNKYKFSEFLTRVKLPITIQDNKQYKRVTIRTKHGGVSVRDHEIGSKIGTKKQFILKEGLFVMSKIDARYGAFGVASSEVNDAIITGNFWAYKINEDIISIDWLNNFTNSLIFYDICERSSSGITHRKYLNEKDFLNNEIWLPPVREQDKIIDSFRERSNHVNSLSRELAHQQALVKKLRQQILQEAIAGKLTAEWRSHNPHIEPASELLKRIAAEKAELVKAKKIKPQKPLPPITDEEKPFELPKGWEWCRLGDLCIKITDGFHNTPPKVASGYPYIAATHVKPDKIDWNACHYVSEEFHKELYSKAYPKKGEILLVNIGAGCGTPAIINVDFEFSFKNTAILKFNQDFLFNKYIFNYFVLHRDEIYKDLTKGGLQPFLSLKILNTIIIPIPSFSEQQAIVAKIEKLLTLCDQLETQITQNQTHAQQLMQAVLKEAFNLTPSD
ncbi:restriction endonuclease subunit S [Spirulina major CS-329]|uniref:restriction endonuclease subunit S n=1 Tax=Spirulina TaxID=1154 RepID=UPI0023300E0D|nr:MULTISPECIES: restriction endonuclease subunit S [Spirulina]MDB9495436.1 restriction endonuclease subunit S [Spirulina subsalsa CS-330]MDB9504084.1 restriction endonuclease subunit S [Spirulina major CS-329]